jgi:hypothetical protein
MKEKKCTDYRSREEGKGEFIFECNGYAINNCTLTIFEDFSSIIPLIGIFFSSNDRT